MRDASVEMKALVTLVHRAHTRRKKLGVPGISERPFDFLFATQQDLINQVWSGDGKSFARNRFDYSVPLEPMGLAFNDMLKSSATAQLIGNVKRRVDTSTSSGSSSVSASAASLVSASSWRTSSSTNESSSLSSNSLSSSSSAAAAVAIASPATASKNAPAPNAFASAAGSYPEVPQFSASATPPVHLAVSAVTGKKRPFNPVDQQFHQPSQPMTVGAQSKGYPHAAWSSKESAWALVALMEAGRKSEPLISVLEKWGEKALNVNDPDFQTWRMPNLDQLKAFTQFTGSAMDRGAMTASLSARASASASASSTGSAKKRRRKKWRFHSNDTQEGKDEMYLKWPLTLENINDYSQRRNKAYLRALDLKGSKDRKAKTYRTSRRYLRIL